MADMRLMKSINPNNPSGSHGLIGTTLAEQMEITDREIGFRKRILGFTRNHELALEACGNYIDMRTTELVEAFYAEQTKIREIELLIGDAETLHRLQSSMKTYVRSLFCGEYDADYVASRLRIGLVHKRIGVPPKLYLCGIQSLQNILDDAVRDYHETMEEVETTQITLDALERLLRFDVGLVFDTYIRSMTAEIEVGRDRMKRHADELELIVKERTEELEKLARRDPLTDLYNQRSFQDELRRETNAARRYGTVMSLAYIDLDGFKQLNDTHGHQAGDEMLRNISKAIAENLRETDIGARYGGDEFCIIMPNTAAKDGIILCERINRSFNRAADGTKVTLSVGIAQSGPDEYLDSKDLIALADQNMYQSKKKAGFYLSVAEVGTLPKKTTRSKAPANIDPITAPDQPATPDNKNDLDAAPSTITL